MGSFGLKNGIAGGRLVVCAGEMESFDFARPIGIGLVESAANLSRILSKNEGEIREVIFVGTCGLYNANAPLMQVFESRAAANVEASAVMDWGYSPIINLAISGEISGKIAAKYVVNPADQARDPLTIFPIVSRETMLINSSNYITTDAQMAARFAQIGFVAENMEAYAVLKTAELFALPARAILCGANHCTPTAHADFTQNHPTAKSKLTKFFKDNF